MIPFYTSNQGKALEDRVEAVEQSAGGTKWVVKTFELPSSHIVEDTDVIEVVSGKFYLFYFDVSSHHIPSNAHVLTVHNGDWAAECRVLSQDSVNNYVGVLTVAGTQDETPEGWEITSITYLIEE